MIRCMFENGDSVSLRHVTMNAIIVKDGKILLCKRGTYKGKPILESGKWALLGGFMDRDENLMEGIRREVREESGWELDGLQLFFINSNPNRTGEDRQNLDVIFIARAVSQAKADNEEVRELAWFDLENLPAGDQFAFDHGKDVALYKEYLAKQFPIPVLG